MERTLLNVDPPNGIAHWLDTNPNGVGPSPWHSPFSRAWRNDDPMFTPPHCPYSACVHHKRPGPGFAIRYGFYKPRCRPWRVPRFRCRGCGRTFSRQTFRPDYCDKRPDCNRRLVRYIASGLSLRQSARNLGMSLRCTELKYRKIASHMGNPNGTADPRCTLGGQA